MTTGTAPVTKNDKGQIAFGIAPAKNILLNNGDIKATVQIDPSTVIIGDSISTVVNLVWINSANGGYTNNNEPIVAKFNGVMTTAAVNTDALAMEGNYVGTFTSSYKGSSASWENRSLSVVASTESNAITLNFPKFDVDKANGANLGSVSIGTIPVLKATTKTYLNGGNFYDVSSTAENGKTFKAMMQVDALNSYMKGDTIYVTLGTNYWNNGSEFGAANYDEFTTTFKGVKAKAFVPETVASKVVGSYKGTMTVTVDGSTRTFNDYVMKTSATTSNDSIKMTFDNFGIDWMTASMVGTMTAGPAPVASNAAGNTVVGEAPATSASLSDVKATIQIDPSTIFIGDSVSAVVNLVWTNSANAGYTKNNEIITVKFNGVIPKVAINADALEMAGDYIGTMTSQYNGSSVSWEKRTLSVAAASESNAVTLTFPKYDIDNASGANLGSVSVGTIPVLKTTTKTYLNGGDLYNISSKADNGKTFKAMMQVDALNSYLKGDTLYVTLGTNYWNNGSEFGASDYAEFTTTFKGVKASTGISSAATKPEVTRKGIYTVAGVHLNTNSIADLPKGIYIVNGKMIAK